MKVNTAGFSRREFLKLGGLGLLGAALPGLPLNLLSTGFFDSQQGRVATRLIWLYDKPSFQAGAVKMYWRDTVLPITDVTVSDNVKDYNRVWYQIGDEGFAYSGTIQPVRTVLNAPALNIPPSGVLGEVSVPFTDAYEHADPGSAVAYRMYYDTVHWILSATPTASDGSIWYQILDDKWNKHYYARGEHLRLMRYDELAPISPNVPNDEKRIQVQLEDQLVFAYEKDNPVFAARISSGARFSDGSFSTPTGAFLTYHKRPTRHMATGDLASDGFDLPGVPWVMYINEAGVSLHGTFWHNDFGQPHSHGCVNLSPASAKWLFRWTTPTVPPEAQFVYERTGTLVNIVR